MVPDYKSYELPKSIHKYLVFYFQAAVLFHRLEKNLWNTFWVTHAKIEKQRNMKTKSGRFSPKINYGTPILA